MNSPRVVCLLTFLLSALVFAQSNPAPFINQPSAPTSTAPGGQLLYSFSSPGGYPRGPLISDAAGNLYGTTPGSGTKQFGTVFELSPPSTAGGAWTETVLYSFRGFVNGDLQNPNGGLTIDRVGNLYGTTPGIPHQKNYGSIFQLVPPSAPGGPWTENVIFVFQRSYAQGAAPNGQMLIDNKGNLYGTTFEGGMPTNSGTVFKLTPPAAPGGTWTETVLHNFDGLIGSGDGAYVSAGLVVDAHNNLYGETLGSSVGCDCGLVYELMPPTNGNSAWTEVILYYFQGPTTNDGTDPQSGLIFDSGGNLFGIAYGGGQFGDGVVFELAPPAQTGGNWTESVLYQFAGGDDGDAPQGPLVLKNGNLYGVTNNGGILGCPTSGEPNGCGAVFQLTPPSAPGGSWNENTLHTFAGSPDAGNPVGGLVLLKGSLYGDAQKGGANNHGAIFSFLP
jgi:uncharacterized repeat protein (TIGR03803 family)